MVGQSRNASIVGDRLRSAREWIFLHKVDLMSMLIISLLGYHLFTSGAFAREKYSEELTGSKISCGGKRGKQIQIITKKGLLLETTKQFDDCEKFVVKLQGGEIFVHYSFGNTIGKLSVDDKVVYEDSPYPYIFFFSFLAWGLFHNLKNFLLKLINRRIG